MAIDYPLPRQPTPEAPFVQYALACATSQRHRTYLAGLLGVDCKSPSGFFTVRVDEVLAMSKQAGVTKMGFVGNEAYMKVV
jgi:hypothetical protein